MKLYSSILLALAMFTNAVHAESIGPMASAWNLGTNPDKTPIISPLLTSWSADTDPNYMLYRDLPDVSPVFAVNNNKSKFVPLMSFSTLATPAQFISGKIDIHQLYTQWSSTPIFVYFGGSQSEGQVLAPTPGLIRAAHIHGTKILGSIFLSPPAYGGNQEIAWLKEMLKPSTNGDYPYADQLIHIAHAYHFDGYFINQEAILFDQTINARFVDFITYINRKAPDLIIDWYQVPAYSTSKQFLLPGTEIFLDYGATMKSWVDLAQSIGFPTENIEYGINGSYQYNLSSLTSYLKDAAKYQTSIGLFAAENITLQNSGNNNSVKLDSALNRIDAFWNGEENKTGANAYMHLQSPVTTLPFYTDFNIGQGNEFFINGLKTSLGQWISPELQSLLPVLQHDTVFKSSYDLTNAYSGSSSLKVNVQPHQDNKEYILYNSRIPVDFDNLLFSVTYQNESYHHDDICISYQSGKKSCIPLLETHDWKTTTIALSDAKDQIITSIYLNSYSNDSPHTFTLGKIYLGISEPKQSTKDVSYINRLNKLWISWNKASEDIYYDIYQLVDNQERFIARTYNNVFCIDAFEKTNYKIKSYNY